jgi:hypothetical protein
LRSLNSNSLSDIVVQYHGNLAKEESLQLYSRFVELCDEKVRENNLKCDYNHKVFGGTHGNRQVLSMDTNGPHSHIVDI